MDRVHYRTPWGRLTSDCPLSASGYGWQCLALLVSTAAAVSGALPPNGAGALSDPSPASSDPRPKQKKKCKGECGQFRKGSALYKAR